MTECWMIRPSPVFRLSILIPETWNSSLTSVEMLKATEMTDRADRLIENQSYSLTYVLSQKELNVCADQMKKSDNLC
jgi:hypothetical protein